MLVSGYEHKYIHIYIYIYIYVYMLYTDVCICAIYRCMYVCMQVGAGSGCRGFFNHPKPPFVSPTSQVNKNTVFWGPC